MRERKRSNEGEEIHCDRQYIKSYIDSIKNVIRQEIERHSNAQRAVDRQIDIETEVIYVTRETW